MAVMMDSYTDHGDEALIARYLDTASGSPDEVEGVWGAIQARISDSPQAPRPNYRGDILAGSRWGAWTIGVLSLCTAMLMFLNFPKIGSLGEGRSYDLREFNTQHRQRTQLKLADGSIVTLAPGSRIRYPSDFGLSTREVHLDGQALFRVAKSDGIPFVVHAANTTTRVLGTSFNVRKYSEDTDVQVTVVEGKVELNSANSPSPNKLRVLGRGDRGTVSSYGELDLERGVETASITSWVTGELVFNSAPLRTAIPDLRRWYNIDIRVSDPRLLDARITTSLKTESVEDILHLLAGALNARAQRNGMSVTFTPIPRN